MDACINVNGICTFCFRISAAVIEACASFLSFTLASNRIEMHFPFTDDFYANLSLPLLLLVFSIIDDTCKNTRNRAYARSGPRDI